MNIWRIHLRPDSQNGNPVNFCIQQGVIGIGWRIDNRPKSLNEYLKMGEEKYGNPGWKKAANAIGWRMEREDLVWTRGLDGIYYLGKIDGEWEYRDDPDNRAIDIINVRPCKLYDAGPCVAGKIIASFRASATIQQIHDESAKYYSLSRYNELSHENIPFDKNWRAIDIFSLLSDIDLEDIVGLYIQKKRNLLFIPSSRSRQNTTISYEYQMIDPKTGRPILAQVKSGNTTINPSDYYSYSDANKYEYYLFSPAGYTQKSDHKNIICLDRKEIEDFLNLEDSHLLLPSNITTWLNLKKQLSQT